MENLFLLLLLLDVFQFLLLLLIGIPIGFTSSAIGWKNCAIFAGIKIYKSIIKKKKNVHDKILLLSKSKLSSMEALISMTLIDSVISHGEFVLINNLLKEYDKIKEEIKILKTESIL